MLVNVIVVAIIAVWGVVALRYLWRTERHAKETGNPGCLGCGYAGGCSTGLDGASCCGHHDFDKAIERAEKALHEVQKKV